MSHKPAHLLLVDDDPGLLKFPFYFQRQRMVNDPAVAKLWFDG